jgi:hypothetical protein
MTELRTSLQRLRNQLERLFCTATGEIDIMRTQRNGRRTITRGR